jgi:hypothetical protein
VRTDAWPSCSSPATASSAVARTSWSRYCPGAHALAHVRGIQDTTRQGRYHNTRYRQLAREIGLHAEQPERFGWTITTLATGTAERYAQALAELEQLSHELARNRERPTEPNGSRPAGMLPCTCCCARRIRVSPSALAAGSIRCRICDSDFTPDPKTTRQDVALCSVASYC